METLFWLLIAFIVGDSWLLPWAMRKAQGEAVEPRVYTYGKEAEVWSSRKAITSGS